MNIKSFDAYLFDFDGTLFDTRESLLPVWKYGFEKVGICGVSEELCEEFMHFPLSYAAEKMGVKDVSAFFDAICEALNFPENIALMKLFPDTIAVVSTLSNRGKPLGIVSSNTSSHIQKALASKGVESYFSVLSCSDQYSMPKPNAEPCLFALRKMNLIPSKSICYVGDSLQDVACGEAAGLTGILLDRNAQHPDFNGKRIASLYELVF